VGAAVGGLAADRRRSRAGRRADDGALRAGEFAGWIAPPSVGINDLPVEYDYVRF